MKEGFINEKLYNHIKTILVEMDVKSKKYYIDLSYLKKNFELVCYMD